MTPEMLTVDDVARITRLSKVTIRAAVRDGELVATRLRRRILVHPDDLAVWIDSGKVTADGAIDRIATPTPRPSRQHPGDPRQAIKNMNKRAA